MEVGEGSGAGVVVSPTTPTPGDDNPVFAIPRTEVRVHPVHTNVDVGRGPGGGYNIM